MRRHRLVLLFALYLSFPLSAGTIVYLDKFHDGEVAIRDGEEWLALTCIGGSWSVVPARVRVERFRDFHDDEKQKTGRSVSVPAVPHAWVLLRDLPGVSSGWVHTITIQRDEVLTFDGERYQLVVNEEDGAASLRNGSRTQAIGGPGFVWTVEWAGDLDRDGKLDCILSFDGDNEGGLKLFLSSLAEPGEMVHLAASISHVGC